MLLQRSALTAIKEWLPGESAPDPIQSFYQAQTQNGRIHGRFQQNDGCDTDRREFQDFCSSCASAPFENHKFHQRWPSSRWALQNISAGQPAWRLAWPV